MHQNVEVPVPTIQVIGMTLIRDFMNFKGMLPKIGISSNQLTAIRNDYF